MRPRSAYLYRRHDPLQPPGPPAEVDQLTLPDGEREGWPGVVMRGLSAGLIQDNRVFEVAGHPGKSDTRTQCKTLCDAATIACPIL